MAFIATNLLGWTQLLRAGGNQKGILSTYKFIILQFQRVLSCTYNPTTVRQKKAWCGTSKSTHEEERVIPAKLSKSGSDSSQASSSSSASAGTASASVATEVTLDSDSETDTTITSPSGEPLRERTLAFHFDSMTAQEKRTADINFRRLVFGVNLPLYLTEHPLWLTFISSLRPAWRPPSRYELTTRHLTEENARVVAEREQVIANSNVMVLMLDGWTSKTHKSLINFLVTVPLPVYLRTVETGVNKHNAVYLCELIVEQLTKLDANKVLAIVTDNAQSMKKAASNVAEQYPGIRWYGCGAHCLNLLVKDVCRITIFQNAIAKLKTVAKYVRNHHEVLAVFHKNCRMAYKKEYSILIPGATRWGAVFICASRLLLVKRALEATVLEPTLAKNMDEEVRETVVSKQFWDAIVTMSSVLRPMVRAIFIAQSDSASLSDIVYVFKQLQDLAKEPTPGLSPVDQLRIMSLVDKRREFCLTPLHYAANILDPRFRGDLLDEAEDAEGVACIEELAKRLQIDDRRVLVELSLYREKVGVWAMETRWRAAEKISAGTWWAAICKKSPLFSVASQLFQAPVSSAAAERNWKDHSNIQTQKRNRLTDSNLGKLVNVSSAIRAEIDRTGKAKTWKPTSLEIRSAPPGNVALSEYVRNEDDWLMDLKGIQGLEDEEDTDLSDEESDYEVEEDLDE